MELTPESWGTIMQVSAPVLAFLLMGNLFLIVRLIRELDTVKQTVLETMPVYTERVDKLENEMKSIVADIKDIGKLRERLAVVEFAQKLDVRAEAE